MRGCVLDGRNGYLDAAALIAAADAAGADAIHPGYGFLSENAEFAAAVQDAGLTWIGPPVAAVAAMGSKIEAKKMMAAAGVPVLEELDPATVTEAQLPVLVKASAGGGGRGMRVVTELSTLPTEVAAARREAGVGVRRRHRVLRALPARAAGTSRCRSSPTNTAPSGRSANGSARSSGATRRSSRRRRRRSSNASPGCATSCSTRPVRRRRRSATRARARWSSSPTRTEPSTSSR